MRGPGLAMFRLDVSKAGARRRVRDADEMVARRALNLPARELRFTFQRLVAVGTIKLEFVRVHSLHLHHAQTGRKKYMKDLSILSARLIRMMP
jgi:hypothetical protein